jgi:hypothetical protein
MAHSVTFRNAAVNAVAQNGGFNYFSLHTGDPGTSGANEVVGGSYARVLATFPAAATGASTTAGATHNVPAGVTVTHFGRWSAASGGTFYTGGTLPNGGDTFGSAGTYTNVNTVSQPS